MFLIADSGSTKTDWLLTSPDTTRDFQFRTAGCNPYFMSRDDMERLFREVEHKTAQIKSEASLPSQCNIENIWFYGAGCTPGEKSLQIKTCLEEVFGKDCNAEVSSDMLGAARALCGTSEGIACILGTGSNSCLYDGSRIVANTPPLGYILGDEGSGANLGKLLVGNLFKDLFGPQLKVEFTATYGTAVEIADRVYKQPFPNRWLASLSPFIHDHLDNDNVRHMVADAFASFFLRNTASYNRPDLKIGLTGSIAYYYKDLIADTAKELGLHLGTITKSPIEGLKTFHHDRT